MTPSEFQQGCCCVITGMLCRVFFLRMSLDIVPDFKKTPTPKIQTLDMRIELQLEKKNEIRQSDKSCLDGFLLNFVKQKKNKKNENVKTQKLYIRFSG